MFLNMLVASTAGVLIPMTLRFGLKVDPATAAGVFDTMLTDIMGFFIFLGLATLMLDRLT
jgi:magnesium transporter